ncbi:MAG: carbonate dehydratase [Rhodocyclaceae bacterium]
MKTSAPKDLLERNRLWSQGVTERDPEFFPRLAAQQAPEYLWIGCSDSRVPANEILGMEPGEVFVHRNVANVVVHTDLNCLSVMQYAVDVLRVKHILVVGHYGCGGVRAAMRGARMGLIDNWLRHVADVRDRYRSQLMQIDDENERVDRLCELNALEQVLHVSETSVLQDAWLRGQDVAVHAWCYGLRDGIVRDLGLSVAQGDSPQDAYIAAIESLMR